MSISAMPSGMPFWNASVAGHSATGGVYLMPPPIGTTAAAPTTR
jgi:hypothetical protein